MDRSLTRVPLKHEWLTNRFMAVNAQPRLRREDKSSERKSTRDLWLSNGTAHRHPFHTLAQGVAARGFDMNMVAKNVEQLNTIHAEGATLLAVISRAAADPQTDVDKMERLMAMYERVEARRAESEFSADLAEMQDALPAIAERGNAAGRYTYALWEDINTAIKPILKRHGFALSFRTDFSNGISITGVLSHKGGHREETSITLPADKSGNKNDVQAVASSVSYGKRYTAGLLLNLTSHGEDDDAYAAGGGYDASDWNSAIDGAASMDELNRIAADLKSANVPASALKGIRARWANKAKELK